MTARPAPTHSLESRVAALEASNRRLRGALGVAALVAIGPLLLAQVQPPPQTLEARRIRVVDASGNAVLDLAADDKGRASLRVREPNGQARAVLDGEGITLYSANGVVTASLRADNGLLLAPGGVRRVHLGNDSLVLGDADGAARVALEIDRGLLVADAKGVARVAAPAGSKADARGRRSYARSVNDADQRAETPIPDDEDLGETWFQVDEARQSADSPAWGPLSARISRALNRFRFERMPPGHGFDDFVSEVFV
ncbi:MAG: hypothetical protein KC466_00665, partial [Myxococcales bacterium]|nr:hypothetical protein [Myxococcales bacterium]